MKKDSYKEEQKDSILDRVCWHFVISVTREVSVKSFEIHTVAICEIPFYFDIHPTKDIVMRITWFNGQCTVHLLNLTFKDMYSHC